MEKNKKSYYDKGNIMIETLIGISATAGFLFTAYKLRKGWTPLLKKRRKKKEFEGKEMQMQRTFDVLSKEQRANLLNPDHPESPFYGYVGNRPAVEFAMNIANQAFDSIVTTKVAAIEGKVKHYASPQVQLCTRNCPARIALYGPKSVGKTKFAKCLAELIGLPYAETDAQQISRPEQLFELLKRTLAEAGVPLVPVKTVGTMNFYYPPPCIVFIDEIHAAKRASQDSLLKATEASDGRLILNNATINCDRICFIIATTDPGKLCQAFKSRFTGIKLTRHSPKEVAQIVYNANPTWSPKDCLRVAFLQAVPRQALDFAQHVKRTQARLSCSVPDAIDQVSQWLGIDAGGLTKTTIECLKVLADAGDAGLSRKSITAALSIEEDEFTNDILPQLLPTQFHKALVRITNRHYITEEGLKELEKRKILV
jgi:Holliday junction resolvasome RuvABC ATP-dependent DNA helicase subunit